MNELYAEVFARHYGVETVGLRYFNVFGRRQDPEGAYAAVIPLWIAHTLRAKGQLMLDEGAIDALVQRGKSLLPSGIIQVSGAFDPGDAVLCTDVHGKEVAKGLINFSSALLERMKGLKTTDIKKTVGDQEYEEAIHRDNLVIL